MPSPYLFPVTSPVFADSPFFQFASRAGLAPTLAVPAIPRRPSIESLGLSTPSLHRTRMPYAMPSPSASPTTTLNVPRPLRHHMRSQSSDALVETSYIYVQPASKTDGPETWAPRAPVAGPSRIPAASGSAFKPAAAPRRVKLFGFTPTDDNNDDGPSSQEDSPKLPEDDEKTPTGDSSAAVAFPFGQQPPLIPVNVGRSKSALAAAARAQELEDAFASRKTHMVRKKSGELVRSSLKTDFGRDRASKPRSMPSTPTCPKYVHFDTQLEHVKHFLSQQRPAAVSRSGSPIETETEDEPEAFPFPAMASAQAGSVQLRLPNFPTPVNPDQDVYLETLEMHPDGKSLRGVVRVKNLAFQKWVAVRFTLDHWQTVSEVSAEHLESMGPMSDRFVFSIRLQDLLARIEDKTMYIALRYTVGDREIWDNNGGGNYRVEFAKRTAKQPANHHGQVAAAPTKRQAWSVTNAGQAADRMADLRRELDRLVQDDMDPSPLHAQTRSFTEGSPSAFSNRYDFGSSLKVFGGRPVSASSGANSQENTPTSPANPLLSVSPSGLIGGMPATLYPEPPASPRPNPNQSSPVVTRANLAPDFGSSSSSPRQHTYTLHNGYAHQASPSLSSQNRPPSPPAEPDLAAMYGPYMAYLPQQDKASSRGRFNSFPSGGGGMQLHTTRAGSGPAVYAPLVVPGFRDHRRRDSPFASPADSPSMSPSDSPALSPQSSSPPRAHSPPLYPTTSPDELWSPASSLNDTASTASTSSTASSVTYSPDSAATSVPDSPLSSSFSPRPSGPQEFSSFLDRYCFHQSQASAYPSSYQHSSSSSISDSTPAQSDYGTPRRGTSIAPATCGPPYFASASSSGASTPAREEITSGSSPLDTGFASFVGPPALVS
ncbi:hypothetical protein RQP46_000588 [Phenoliferia psychrophenolica]